jgi:YegS/Rv2252/BmrU family lipid kinase
LESFRAKRAAIIYNPVARTLSRRQHLLQRTIEQLARQGIEATLVATTAPGTASTQARRQIEGGCDLILAAGGDGTINEVANGMLHSSVPLAILPGGTANVLARETRIPVDMLKAAEQIPGFRPIRIAVGVLRAGDFVQRLFLSMAGAGLDAEIVHHLNLGMKAALGKFAYYLGGFSQAFRPLREFEVSVDGKPYQASFALVSRVRNYGGDLEIARGASLLRNEFEVVLFRGTQGLQYIPYLVGVAIRQAHRMNGCTILRGRSVTCRGVAGQEIFTQVDGELAGQLPMTAEIVPDALTLLVPVEYLTREQSLVDISVCA